MLPFGRAWSRAVRPLSIGAVAALVGTAGCEGGASGPDGTGVGYLALQPSLPADIQNGQFSLGIDAVGLTLRRAGLGDLVIDTVLAFHPDSQALHAAIQVGMLRRIEEFTAELTLLDDDLLLFGGTKLVLLQQGPPGTNPPDSIPVTYRGPGRDIASIRVQPNDTVLLFGESFPLRVLALDSGNVDLLAAVMRGFAEDVLRGVDRNQALIVGPRRALAVWRAQRFLPGLVERRAVKLAAEQRPHLARDPEHRCPVAAVRRELEVEHHVAGP